MDMRAYLSEIEHAATSIIALIWSEHETVEKTAQTLRRRGAETAHGYRQAQALGEDDDVGLATGIYWDTYFGPDKERHHAEVALTDAQAVLAARAFSRAALSSAVLQYAKQGISIVHGKPKNAPAGRRIHNLDLKDLIRQARNQSLHWEENNPNTEVKACFNALKSADSAFRDYVTSNKAFEIVQLLGWRNWAAFEGDMLLLS